MISYFGALLLAVVAASWKGGLSPSLAKVICWAAGILGGRRRRKMFDEYWSQVTGDVVITDPFFASLGLLLGAVRLCVSRALKAPNLGAIVRWMSVPIPMASGALGIELLRTDRSAGMTALAIGLITPVVAEGLIVAAVLSVGLVIGFYERRDLKTTEDD